MKVRKIVVFLITLLFLSSVGSFAFAAKSDWPQQLRFPSGPPGGTWFALGGAISDMWTKNVIHVGSGSGGGTSNIVNVARGQADLGLSVTSALGAAVKGIDPFKEPVNGVSLFATLQAVYLFYYA